MKNGCRVTAVFVCIINPIVRFRRKSHLISHFVTAASLRLWHISALALLTQFTTEMPLRYLKGKPMGLVVSNPLVSNLLRHSLDVLGRILGLCTTAYVKEVVAALGNEEALLITCGIAVGTNGNLLDEGRGFGIIFLLANNLNHFLDSFLSD